MPSEIQKAFFLKDYFLILNFKRQFFQMQCSGLTLLFIFASPNNDRIASLKLREGKIMIE
jgi:hypothetical protein